MQDTMRRKIQMRCKVPAYDEVPGDEDAIMPMEAIDACRKLHLAISATTSS
jgi:hypothetical protein